MQLGKLKKKLLLKIKKILKCGVKQNKYHSLKFKTFIFLSNQEIYTILK